MQYLRSMHTLCIYYASWFLYVVGKSECKNCEVGVAQTRGTGYSNFFSKTKHSKLFSKPSKILCCLKSFLLVGLESSNSSTVKDAIPRKKPSTVRNALPAGRN